MKKKFHHYFELMIWLTAVACVACMDPAQSGFSFCAFKAAGFAWCSGCGIAHAMCYALHGNFSASLKEHLFGIPALLIVANRVMVLFISNFKKYKSLLHGL